ncbi:hypothetical protein [Glycomyces tarimensis]
MRALFISIGVVAAVLVVIGLLIEALQWLLIIGLLAFLAAVIAGVVLIRREIDKPSDVTRRD